jgi:lysine/ornithine N-monooxygenase
MKHNPKNNELNTYVGTRIITALPMSRLEYNQYRSWQLPSNEEGSDEGYLVESTDGEKSNDSRHIGYISWSPKDQFEAVYLYLSIGEVSSIPKYLQRIVAEKVQLKSKLELLTAFLNCSTASSVCDSAEIERLNAQVEVMLSYSKILNERIKAFYKV